MRKFMILFMLLFLSLVFTQLPARANGDFIIGPDVIYKQADKVLTRSDILPLYSSDLGSLDVYEDNYTGYGDVPGIYTMILNVEGTAYTKAIEINVRNIIGDKVTAVTMEDDHYTIHVFKNYLLSSQDIIDALVRINVITVSSQTSVSILTNTYAENANAPGLYLFEFRLAATSGYESLHEVTIRVANSTALEPDIELEPPSSNLGNVIWITLGVVAVVVVLAIVFRKR